ncbi:MAG: hypothetical protein IKO11_08045, partial [Lachnospiraceae bacterium]|nr:hypothetical protein [Lachnospiraceae bacterium]
VSKMDNTIEIKASNCDTDTTSDGSIQVGAAEVLVVESSLTSGKLNIRVLADGKDKNAAADAEQEFSGNDTGELSVPGEGAYDIYCYVLEEGTSGTVKIYTKAAETTAAVKETETEAAAEETETEAADESEADLDVADDGEEGMPALQEAAIAVDDLLVREWGELRDVTYTLDENTIYVSLWADGINNETIDDVTNWDEVTNMFDYLADGCADIMKDAGLEDGLVRLHFVSDETNDAYLIYENKDVVWDYFANESDGADVQGGESGGYLIMSEEEQKAAIADYVGCDADNLEYVGDGTYNNEESVSVYSYVDNGGGEADIRFLLFDDGIVLGYTPDGNVISVEGYFAQ